MAWVYAIVAVIAIVLYVTAPSPKPQTEPPPGLGNIKAPTAEEGRELGVLFGTRDMEAPNVTWFGHLKTIAVKTKGGKK